MKTLSLTTRLALVLSALVMLMMAAVGYALYRTLEQQLIIRDDGALITRVEQIRTLLPIQLMAAKFPPACRDGAQSLR